MAELGNTLSRARRARGITLEEVERDTHVSKRYLQALETEDFSTFPAPVYARGFLRTYSRYLGLNPEELIRVFPNGDLTVDLAPLPSVSRPPTQVINVNWVVAGAVALFLLLAAFLLYRSGSDTATPSSAARRPDAAQQGGSAVIAPAAAATAAVQGKPIAPARAGVMPDFVGADKSNALAALRDNQFSYVIVEVIDKATPRGIVISQAPAAGARSASDLAVTLYVSLGP